MAERSSSVRSSRRFSKQQNQAGADRTVIPATYLKVTVRKP